MGFVFFLTAGIMALDNYVVYRNRPGNLNAGRSLGVRTVFSFILMPSSTILELLFVAGNVDYRLFLLPAQRCCIPDENLYERLRAERAAQAFNLEKMKN